MKTKDVLIFAVLISTYFFLNLSLLFDKPAIWPDEAVYHDLAVNIITEHRPGTDLWKSLIPHVDTQALWNPPLFFYSLAGWFSLFGSSLVSQRLFSSLMGLVTLMLVFWAAKIIIPQPSKWWLPFLPWVGLLSDFQFMRGFRLSRPEILSVPLITASVFVLLHPSYQINNSRPPKNVPKFFIAGLLTGLAFLAHPLSICFILTLPIYLTVFKQLNHRAIKPSIVYLLGFLGPIIIWLTAISNYWLDLLTQFSLAAHRKSVETPWVIDAFSRPNIFLQLIFLGLITVSLWIFWLSYISKDARQRFLSLSLLLSWIITTLGTQIWYIVYVLPFFYLSLTRLLNHQFPSHRSWVGKLLILFFIINASYTLITTYQGLTSPYSYQDYTNDILNLIPNHTSVFLSAIPDPYFGFVSTLRNNTLYEFPVYQLSLDKYQSVLDSVDYVVYTQDHSRVVFGRFLDNYLNLNSQSIISIGKPDGYHAQIFKLKPVTRRVSVI